MELLPAKDSICEQRIKKYTQKQKKNDDDDEHSLCCKGINRKGSNKQLLLPYLVLL